MFYLLTLFVLLFSQVHAKEAKQVQVSLNDYINDSAVCYEFFTPTYLLDSNDNLIIIAPNVNTRFTSCLLEFNRIDKNGNLLNSIPGFSMSFLDTPIHKSDDDFVALLGLFNLCESDSLDPSFDSFCSDNLSSESKILVNINGDTVSPVFEEIQSILKFKDAYGSQISDLIQDRDSQAFVVHREPRSRDKKKLKWRISSLTQSALDSIDLNFNFIPSASSHISLGVLGEFFSKINNKLKLFNDFNYLENGNFLFATKFSLYSFNSSSLEKILSFSPVKLKSSSFEHQGIVNIESFSEIQLLTYVKSFNLRSGDIELEYFMIKNGFSYEIDSKPLHIIDVNNYFSCKSKVVNPLPQLVLYSRPNTESNFSTEEVFTVPNSLGCSFLSSVLSKSGSELIILQKFGHLIEDYTINDAISSRVIVYVEAQ